MKVKIEIIEPYYPKNYSLNNLSKKCISDLENGMLEVNGDETLTISNFAMRDCIINLNDYDCDIKVQVFQVKRSIQGNIIGVVSRLDESVIVVNAN